MHHPCRHADDSGRAGCRSSACGAAGSVSADVFYVDGSHEYADVLSDVRDWFPFLRGDASAMVGDDWGWPGIVAAVNEKGGGAEEEGPPAVAATVADCLAGDEGADTT